MAVKKDLENYLREHVDVAYDVVNELNGWDNYFPQFEVYDFAELIQMMTFSRSGCQDLVDLILSSLDDLHYGCDYVRFNEYQDLIESIDMKDIYEEIQDYVDVIVDAVIDEYNNINIDNGEFDLLVRDYLFNKED